MKIAIVHDFLMQMGGAEKVVEVLHEMYPDAPIYTSLYDPKAMPPQYRDWDIRTSFMQKLVGQKTHRAALLLYPMAFESFDFSDYDVVISSSSAFAKGIITQPRTAHICYKHAPMRYAWMTDTYMNKEKTGRFARSLLVPGIHYLRMWDLLSASRVDHYVANSSVVARRIRKFYGRDCDLVYPPVDISRFDIAPEVGDYCIIVSRFAPYKRIDLAVEAFTRMKKPLKVIGAGRQMKELQAKAGSCVEFLGRLSDKETSRLMAGARAYIMPGEEDFGIAPVEANACGRPVIAYAAGGALDTQIDGETGVLFHQQTVDSLCEAVQRMEQISWNPQRIRANAQRFATEVFREQMAKLINEYSNQTVRTENAPHRNGVSQSRAENGAHVSHAVHLKSVGMNQATAPDSIDHSFHNGDSDRSFSEDRDDEFGDAVLAGQSYSYQDEDSKSAPEEMAR